MVSRLSLLQGDWKISGLGMTIPLLTADGSPSRWEFPGFDGRVPSYIQRSFDYIGISISFAVDCQVKTLQQLLNMLWMKYSSQRLTCTLSVL